MNGRSQLVDSAEVIKLIESTFDSDNTLSLVDSDYVTERSYAHHYYVKAAEAISAGEVVMFGGVQGDHILAKVADFDAAGFIPEWIMGVANTSIALNDWGRVTAIGRLEGVDTSSFSNGDLLYADPSNDGGFTTTKPSSPDHAILVAAVLKAAAGTSGIIQVRLTHKPDTDEVPEGSSNLYYTTARADSDFDVRLATKSTTDVSEGSNLYYTTLRHDSDAGVYLTDNSYATQSYVTTAIDNLIDGAPGTLNTLNEIAAALNDDDSAYATLVTLIGTKTDFDSADANALITSYGYSTYDSADTLGLVDSGYVLAKAGVPTGITLGSANELLVVGGDGTSIVSDSTLAVDTSNNRLGINQTSPEVTLHMTGVGAQTAQIRMEQYNDNADAPDVRTRRYRGTVASPSAIQSGDYLFRSNHEYYNGSSLIVGGQFAFDNTNNANRTQFTVAVTTDGTSVEASSNDDVQFKIDGNDSGAITFNNAYKFPTSDGTANQFLQTDGSGNLTFADGIDSAQVQSIVNASYIQSNQITYNTSDFTDSAYVTGLPVSTFTNDANYLDSSTVTGVISSSYIQSNQITYNTSDFTDSAYVTSVLPTLGNDFVDSAQVQSIVNASYIQSNQITYNTSDFTDSAYVTSVLPTLGNDFVDSAQVQSIVNASYIQGLQTTYNTSDFTDSAYVTSLPVSTFTNDVKYLDSSTVTGVINAAYVQSVQNDIYRDSAFVTNIVDSDYVGNRVSGYATVDDATALAIALG